ncbi:MAG: SDR family oxidoreductase [Sphingomonas sp.]|nr:SDR family oxidoreductase [Sphingomonas sp.]
MTDGGACSSVDVAPMLVQAGATVIIADHDAGAVRALAQSIDPTGKRAIAIETDTTSEDSVIALFAAARERFGRCDILVNCAGLTANAPIRDTSMAHYDDMQAINQRAIFMLMREAVRLMLDVGGGGRIVNVSTMGTLHPVLHGNAAYGASRAGVVAMTRAVALDHARDGILANLVLPGAVHGKTRFHRDTAARLSSGGALTGPAMDAERRLPLGMGNGRDIATAVLYLVGPSASYITGQSITLDGGFLLT